MHLFVGLLFVQMHSFVRLFVCLFVCSCVFVLVGLCVCLCVFRYLEVIVGLCAELLVGLDPLAKRVGRWGGGRGGEGGR